MTDFKEKYEVTEEDVKLLLEDWFDRDGDTFVKIKHGDHRLDWEDRVETGEAYSTYLIEAPTDKDLIKRAYPTAKDLLIAMMLPCKVHLQISKNGHKSYTDGKRVVVSTDVFDDTSLTNGGKLDVFMGLTIHEGAHIKYTDFAEYSKSENKITAQIQNILEDERIEMLVGEDTPGFGRFIEAVKYYYFDNKFLEDFPKEEDKMNDFEKIFLVFLRVIRFPTYLKEEDFYTYGEKLIQIKNVLSPYPETTKDVVEASALIYKILLEFVTEEMLKKEAGEEGTPDELSDEDLRKGERLMGEMSKELIKTCEEMTERSGEVDGDYTPNEAGLLARDGILAADIEGSLEVSDEGTVFIKQQNSADRYKEDLKVIEPYIAAVSRKLKGHSRDYKLVHRSMRSGTLDTNKLADAVQGVPTIYMREGEVKTDKINVCILIDESGSMKGTKEVKARQSAILLKEAMEKIPFIGLFIYGHSGDIIKSGITELYTYYEPGFTPKYALGNCKARAQNRDGVAIHQAAKRVRKFNKNPCVMFVISDGAPCANNYGGDSAVKHTREQVQKVEKNNFQVIQVCIQQTYNPAEMFKHFMILTDWNLMAVNLGKAVKKAVEKLSPITVS